VRGVSAAVIIQSSGYETECPISIGRMNKTVTRAKISKFELVYLPISNQEGVWLQNDPDVERELLNKRFRRRHHAREHGLWRNKQADLARHALRIAVEKRGAWEGELHVRNPRL
jgi:hypothetical protein